MAVLDWTWSCSDWALLMLIAAVLLYYIGTSNYSHFSKRNVPFVKPLPFVGSMGPVLLGRQHFPYLMMEIYNKLKDHPYGGFFLFKGPIIVPTDPELIKTIAVKDFEYLQTIARYFQRMGILCGRGDSSALKVGICVLCVLTLMMEPVTASETLVLADDPAALHSVFESCQRLFSFLWKIKGNMQGKLYTEERHNLDVIHY